MGEPCSNELSAPIFAVDEPQEAIRFANDTRFGPACYVFTESLSHAVAFGATLDFGMIGINRGIMADAAAPFGGVKTSGLGREAGQGGIYEFMEPKYMAMTVNNPLVATA